MARAVRLKDVARIELGALTYNQSGRYNGRPSALVAVFQAPGANALAVADGVKKMMGELKARFPSDMDYAVGLDTTLPVTEGIKEIVTTIVAVTIAIAVVISAFNALSLSPALSALLLRPRREARGALGRFFGAFNRGFARATHGYVDLSHGLVRKMALSLVILAGFAVVAGGLGRRLPTGFIADEDQGFLLMNVQLPDAASLQRTDAVTRKIEAMLKDFKGVHSVVTINGFSLLTRTSASYTAFFFVALDPWDERRPPGLSSAEILASLNGALQRSRRLPRRDRTRPRTRQARLARRSTSSFATSSATRAGPAAPARRAPLRSARVSSSIPPV